MKPWFVASVKPRIDIVREPELGHPGAVRSDGAQAFTPTATVSRPPASGLVLPDLMGFGHAGSAMWSAC